MFPGAAPSDIRSMNRDAIQLSIRQRNTADDLHMTATQGHYIVRGTMSIIPEENISRVAISAMYYGII
jgi:hypothetical protein